MASKGFLVNLEFLKIVIFVLLHSGNGECAQMSFFCFVFSNRHENEEGVIYPFPFI